MSAKTKTVWFCSNCGNEYSKWMGKCPSCGEWNTYVEEVVRKESAKSLQSLRFIPDNGGSKPVCIDDVETSEEVACLGDGYWPLQSWKVSLGVSPLGGHH